MHLTTLITTFLLFLGLAVALPTDASDTTVVDGGIIFIKNKDNNKDTENKKAAGAVMDKRINLCSPNCKKELAAWESCIYLPYCRDSYTFNLKQKAYDDCCKVAGRPPTV